MHERLRVVLLHYSVERCKVVACKIGLDAIPDLLETIADRVQRKAAIGKGVQTVDSS